MSKDMGRHVIIVCGSESNLLIDTTEVSSDGGELESRGQKKCSAISLCSTAKVLAQYKVE